MPEESPDTKIASRIIGKIKDGSILHEKDIKSLKNVLGKSTIKVEDWKILLENSIERESTDE